MRKDGSRFWANVIITALRNPEGTLVGFAKVTRDLTERRQAEEDRARARGARRPRSKRRLAFRSSRSASWPSWVTTCVILWPPSTWARHCCVQREDDPVASRILERMNTSARRMSRMIEQILDLTRSRLAGGLELTREAMDLRDTLEAIVDELRTAHPAPSHRARSLPAARASGTGIDSSRCSRT